MNLSGSGKKKNEEAKNGVSLVDQMVNNLPAMQEIKFDPCIWKIPGEGNGYQLQYSCLENSMNRRAWRATGSQSRM